MSTWYAKPQRVTLAGSPSIMQSSVPAEVERPRYRLITSIAPTAPHCCVSPPQPLPNTPSRLHQARTRYTRNTIIHLCLFSRSLLDSPSSTSSFCNFLPLQLIFDPAPYNRDRPLASSPLRASSLFCPYSGARTFRHPDGRFSSISGELRSSPVLRFTLHHSPTPRSIIGRPLFLSHPLPQHIENGGPL